MDGPAENEADLSDGDTHAPNRTVLDVSWSVARNSETSGNVLGYAGSGSDLVDGGTERARQLSEAAA